MFEKPFYDVKILLKNKDSYCFKSNCLIQNFPFKIFSYLQIMLIWLAEDNNS